MHVARGARVSWCAKATEGTPSLWQSASVSLDVLESAVKFVSIVDVSNRERVGLFVCIHTMHVRYIP